MATTTNIGSDMLAIGDPVLVNESIKSFEYREYEAQNPLALNSGGTITIDIQNHDIFTNPSKSVLLVEGRLTSTTAAANDNAKLDAFVNKHRISYC